MTTIARPCDSQVTPEPSVAAIAEALGVDIAMLRAIVNGDVEVVELLGVDPHMACITLTTFQAWESLVDRPCVERMCPRCHPDTGDHGVLTRATFDQWRSLPTRGLHVYDLVKAGEVIYVGCSRQVRLRVKAHAGLREFDSVDLLGPFRSRDEAEAVERTRIEHLRPPENIAGVRIPYAPHPDRRS